ncbi:Pkinase-fungal domain-containing protein [Mycena kentingensis (nom. inval.)]|nr:Pkinase-fungal domain-containing protein [Mycena kentingensis (nom. inval.)]
MPDTPTPSAPPAPSRLHFPAFPKIPRANARSPFGAICSAHTSAASSPSTTSSGLEALCHQPPGKNGDIFSAIQDHAAAELAAAKEILQETQTKYADSEKAAAAAKKSNSEDTDQVKIRKDENCMMKPLLDFLNKLMEAAEFRDNHVVFLDTHTSRLQPDTRGEPTHGPDIGSLRPNLPAEHRPRTDSKRKFAFKASVAALIWELKFHLDAIDDKSEQIVDSKPARKALTQLAVNARHLLMDSGRCHAYVLAGFSFDRARIYRFDRGGWQVTKPFSWVEKPDVLVKFLYRFYRPGVAASSAIDGDDDTIEPAPEMAEKIFEKICGATCDNGKFYANLFPTKEKLRGTCFRIKAARRDETGKHILVNCLTIGSPLSITDGLFSRATRVYRVVVEDDLYADGFPAIYALKDGWRERCRRSELDSYDLIAAYCKQEGIDMTARGMAQCYGSLDLSERHLGSDGRPLWDATNHRTSSMPIEDPHERLHTRLLLGPVGAELKRFTHPRQLVGALLNGIEHHKIAYEAGLLHRDVSEGNLMFIETTIGTHATTAMPMAFLVDYDYAEFTPEGVENFNRLVAYEGSGREPAVLREARKGMRHFTGTAPFVAIEILDTERNIPHAFYHDLESFYWLLVWMILRYTTHSHLRGDYALDTVFSLDIDPLDTKKAGFLSRTNTIVELIPGTPLATLIYNLHNRVASQNPSATAVAEGFGIAGMKPAAVPAAIYLTYEEVLQIFETIHNTETDDWAPLEVKGEYTIVAEPNTEQFPIINDTRAARSAAYKSGGGTSAGRTLVSGARSSKRAAPDTPRDAGDDEDASVEKKAKTGKGTAKATSRSAA